MQWKSSEQDQKSEWSRSCTQYYRLYPLLSVKGGGGTRSKSIVNNMATQTAYMGNHSLRKGSVQNNEFLTSESPSDTGGLTSLGFYSKKMTGAFTKSNVQSTTAKISKIFHTSG